MCEFMRENGRYISNPSKIIYSNSYLCSSFIELTNLLSIVINIWCLHSSFPKYNVKKKKHMTQGSLYNIVEDLCTFILKEVIPCKGKYHNATSILARPDYKVLTKISRLNLSRDDY